MTGRCVCGQRIGGTGFGVHARHPDRLDRCWDCGELDRLRAEQAAALLAAFKIAARPVTDLGSSS